MDTYLDLAVEGVRSRDIAQKIELHLERFTDFFVRRYGHTRISTVLKRDVLEWMKQLRAEETEVGEHAALAPDYGQQPPGLALWLYVLGGRAALRPLCPGQSLCWRQRVTTACADPAYALRGAGHFAQINS